MEDNMLAIAPTGKDWFAQLRARSSSQIINFWTPTPWNVKGLSRGDLLYFLLKAPIRKIGGYGHFIAHENMSASKAWKRFGTNNGARSLMELINRTSNYAQKHSKHQQSRQDPQIGCILLRECIFLGDGQFYDPASYGFSFHKNVVKLKY